MSLGCDLIWWPINIELTCFLYLQGRTVLSFYSSLLGCDAASPHNWLTLFQRNVSPSSSGVQMFLCNLGNNLPSNAASHPKRPESLIALLWKIPNSHSTNLNCHSGCPSTVMDRLYCDKVTRAIFGKLEGDVQTGFPLCHTSQQN
jgi:hypothetical protein